MDVTSCSPPAPPPRAAAPPLPACDERADVTFPLTGGSVRAAPPVCQVWFWKEREIDLFARKRNH